jgi:hypothetical protein
MKNATRILAAAVFVGAAHATAYAQFAHLDASCPGAAARVTEALETQAGRQTQARELQVSLRIADERIAHVRVDNATSDQRRAVRSALLGLACTGKERADLRLAVQMLPPLEATDPLTNAQNVASAPLKQSANRR